MKVKFPDTVKTKAEKFDWLHENHDDILYAKKNELKEVDISGGFDFIDSGKSVAEKGEFKGKEAGVLEVKVIINTTNIRDSHKDVHFPGIWNKTLKENKRLKHVQEHAMTFDKIIADKDDLKAYVETFTWKELGFDFSGKTEALVFESKVRESRNANMYKEYKDGNVDNHSVSMIYVKIKFAMDSDESEHKAYKATYDEYIDEIANKEVVEKDGYFWAVFEAKAREGSAVVDGSNFVTPTLSSREKHSEGSGRSKAEENSLSNDNQAYLNAVKEILT